MSGKIKPKEGTIIIIGDSSLKDKFIPKSKNVKIEFVEVRT